MKRQMKTPRILKVLNQEGFIMDIAFRNGEIKRVDFSKVLENIIENDPLKQLKDNSVFATYSINENGVLFWPKTLIEVEIPGLAPIQSNLEMDPEVLYYLGENSPFDKPLEIGPEIKSIRLSKNLTLSQLAVLCGISESELSRVENNKNIELDTLRRIFFFGFNMNLKISGTSVEKSIRNHNYRKSQARLSKITKRRELIRFK